MLPVKAIVAVACFVNLVFEWKRGLIYLLLTVEVFELKQSFYGKIGDMVSLDPRLSPTLSDERNP